MAKATLTLRGLDTYLAELAQAGENIDEVVAGVMGEAREPAGGLMYHYLRGSSESWTGAMASNIVVSPVQRDGNYIFIELSNTDPGAHSKEYGRSRQAAEPFLRPTLSDYRRNQIARLLKQALERIGAL